jgi:protease-4
VIFLCFWTVVVLVIGIAAGGAATGLSAGAAHALPVKVLDKGDGIRASTVALIPVSGAIMGGGTHLEGEGTIHTVARKLNAARNNADVRAVILQVSSPGGSLTASDLLYHEVRRLKASGKTVIVMIGDLAASGGYYVAAPADYIVASPTSLVGSIGVIWYRFQVSELMERIGVKPEPIESVEMKDFMSPFRDLTPEEREHARELLATAHDRFVEIIVEGRGLPEATVRSLADGRIYTAGDALDLGLVDEIGYIDAAIEKAREIAGLTHRPRIIAYGEPFELEDLFRLRGGRGLDAGRLLRAAEEAARPRRAAIWTGSSGE